MANIEEKVEKLLTPIIENVGYELYDVEYAKEGKDYFLRVFIDKEGGIDLDDCQKVNDGINDMLDDADYIKEQYFLEISSPGIERVLRKDEHLQNAIGEEIEISLFKPVDGKKEYSGFLKGFNKEKIMTEDIELLRSDISLIKIKYNW